MTVSLILSRRNNGVRYQAMSEIGLLITGKTTEVRRWDSQSRQFIPIAERERRSFELDAFKFPREDTIPVSTFMARKMSLGKR